ncbi:MULTISPECIES: ArsR/SmtB family transcription factor [Gordonia]|jgi:DNA-binding transcriptional ArsR family regulator|uniref:Putative ArsR family transcriptional regulator n=1 Tax=Gordonia malaquae NBRC 108250 TaxID=1223542 RepID=M3UYI3_GORML|nr:metalloregulator ArsR/SmtB family transcription factor [Gordonia malaquae]GAC80927.1 putative ArsR family transcriptional regulator [Gordonia malaquae NBRC 108250]
MVHPSPSVTPTTDHAGNAAAADLLRSLASPARVAIVLSLRERSMCVHELVDALHLNQPQVSQHLSVLKKSGVVVGTRRGREIDYALADDHVAHIVVDALIHASELREAKQ